MLESFGIKESVIELSKKVDEIIKTEISKVDSICEYNSLKVLSAFQKNKFLMFILIVRLVMDMEILVGIH